MHSGIVLEGILINMIKHMHHGVQILHEATYDIEERVSVIQ